MKLRYLYERHSGEGDPCVIQWVTTTPDREEIALGVGICCWMYVCEYGSVGQRSEENWTRYEKTTEKNNAHDRT